MITDGFIWLGVGDDAGTGVILIAGYEAIDVAWDQAGDGLDPLDRCLVAVLTPASLDVAILGTVSAVGSDDRVWVVGCGSGVRTAADGSFYFTTRPGHCSLQAVWRDGALTIWGDLVEVEAKIGEDNVVALDRSPLPAGGVGLVARPVDHGFQIVSVLEGSAADVAGVRPGEVVQSVDGEPVDDPGIAALVGRVVGEPGTTVVLGLHDGDHTREVVLERHVLDAVPACEQWPCL